MTSDRSNVEIIITEVKDGSLPDESTVVELCKNVQDLFKEEPNIVFLTAPLTIVGDIHGQFLDLLQIFHISGEVSECNYLFLGDYVDRGMHGIETIILLFALKLKQPRKITMIRGNHESRGLTQVYGFYDECLEKYGSANVWKAITAAFDTLPSAALIDDRVFCVHGGLSPKIKTLDQIRTLDRIRDVPVQGPMCDLLWSDPHFTDGFQESPRGAGYLFGADVTATFNRDNGVDYLCRAHQLVQEGYQWHFGQAALTVWSAPNYCYRCGNLAAILRLDEHLNSDIVVFKEQLQDFDPTARKPRPLDYFM